jgi:hypothetical protein
MRMLQPRHAVADVNLAELQPECRSYDALLSLEQEVSLCQLMAWRDCCARSRLPTMASMWAGECRAGRAGELGLPTSAPALVRKRGAGSARTQNASGCSKRPACPTARRWETSMKNSCRPKFATAAADVAGRPLCRTCGKYFGVRTARPRQDAFFGRAWVAS